MTKDIAIDEAGGISPEDWNDILESIARAKKQIEDAEPPEEIYRFLQPSEENGPHGRQYWENLGYKVVIVEPLTVDCDEK